jgi:hypothetical protein
MAEAIPTNYARTQSESVASLAVASEAARTAFDARGTVKGLFFFRPPSIECWGLHRRHIDFGGRPAQRTLQLKSASSKASRQDGESSEQKRAAHNALALPGYEGLERRGAHRPSRHGRSGQA